MVEDKLIVCDLNRTSICNLLDNTPERARNIIENRETNIITELKFDLPIANPKWVNIKNENLILFKDEYYVIKTPTFNHDEDGKLYVNVVCKHYSNNLAEDLISIEETEPVDVIQLMKLALCYDADGNPTKGWTVGRVTVDRVALRGLEAMEQSPFSILLTIAEKYNGMLYFNSQSMTVDLLELEDTTKPTIDIRGSKNLKSVSISYDTSEMYTRLYCYGAPDEDDNELDIMSVNPTTKPYIDNFDYYYKLGYPKEFVESHPELFVKTTIWRDSNYYDPQDLYDDGVKELAKIAVPIVEVDIMALDVATLGKDGNPCDLQVGDCVRIVDEELGLDTLCNVTKREINYEEPYILNITVTNSITYHDTLSKLFTNVNTVSSLVTSGGNIIGSTNMNEVEDYLNMYYLNVEQIEAKYATIGLLTTEYLTADQIKASYIDATTIGATYATIASLNAIEAKIKDLDVTELKAELANIETLVANLGEFDKLVANDAEIADLKAGTITVVGKIAATNAEIDNLKATKVEVGDFNAYKATIENLIATKASIEELEANYIKASQIEATYAKITELNAVKANIETLDADLANIETLVANKADITDLNAVNATVTKLNADVAEINKLVTTKVDADYVEAEIVKATKTITDDLTAIHAVVDVFDTKYATIEQLNAAKAELNTLIAEKASIEQLNAVEATIGQLDALVANINTVLAGAVGTGTLQTIHLTAQNVVIDDAIIKSAMIEGLDVSKLNAGTISTDKFIVQSDNGGILISGSTMQFKDKNNKVRLQVGQDAQGNFNFIVFGEDGTTAIYNENGITKNAVPDGLIVNDMVNENANIDMHKVNIDSLFEVINSDGSNIIKSDKIWVDEENQSLGAKFNQVTQSISTKVGQTEVDEAVDNVKVGAVNLIRNAKTMDYFKYGIKENMTAYVALLNNDNAVLLDVNDNSLIAQGYSASGEMYIVDLPTSATLSDDSLIFINQNNTPLWISSAKFKEAIGSSINLDNYYTKNQSDSKYQLKGNYLTSIPDEYITQNELTNALQVKADISALNGKVNINQGTSNSGKLLSVNSSGNVALVDPPAYTLPMASNTGLGGIKAKAKSTETVEVAIDTQTGKLYVPTYPTISEGGEVSTDYTTLTSKPQINGIELNGNLTLTELGIQPKGDYLTSIPSEYITDSKLNSKGYLTSIPSEYITETELNEKGFLTEHQDISGKADITGQVFTGTIEAPIVKANNYFVTPSLVGEGDNTKYYHRVNFGYASHNYWEFHEYGGDYRFYKNTAGTSSGGTLIANITSDYSNFAGQLRENNVRVYSPNNKPTASDLGITVPNKTSELTNDSGFLTSIPSEYITETELNARVPSITTADNDKILQVVNGVPTWVSIVNAEGVKY